jgi:hypothetical protein
MGRTFVQLQFGVDESYEIEVPGDGSKAVIRVRTASSITLSYESDLMQF